MAVTASEQATPRPLLSCLATIAQHHQLTFSADAAMAGLAQSKGDLTPSSLPIAAERFGLATRIVRRQLDDVNQHLLPAVVLLKSNRACVITAVDGDNLAVIDPDMGDKPINIARQTLEQQYTGDIIYVRPEFTPDKRANDAITRKDKHWFWSVIKENRGTYRNIIIASLMINAFALAMPLFVMNVYDRVVPNNAISTLFALAIGMLVILVAEVVLKIIRIWFIDLSANRTDVKVSSTIMRRVLNMRMSDKPQASGSFISSIQSFESVRSFIGSLSVTAMVDIPFVMLFFIVVGIINVYLLIPVVVAALIIIIYSLASQAKLRELAEQSMQASAMRNANIYESIGSIETIKSFNAQHRSQTQWEKSTIFLSRINARMRLLSQSITSVASWLQQAASISVIVIGVFLISEELMTQGALIAAYLLSARALSPVTQAAGLLAQYHNSATAMESLDGIMERETERSEDPTTVSKPRIDGDIELVNVGFRYPDVESDVLSGVNISIKAGEKIAILGRNGSGKSTVQRLLLGLYDASSGRVLIDGVDIRQLNPNLVRRHIGYVPQDANLIFGTLRENILLGRQTIDDEALVRVTNEMGLAPLVRNHPKGFNLQVGERGGNLSGGQRQSVALARAFVDEPSIVLLDEPTGMLDHATEGAIKKRLADQVENKTLIMVTHKTTMLDLVDRIIVMDSGRVVADGAKQTVLEALRQGRIGGVSRD
ncbi:type I secretion system permease/ATPase [Idiomarina seosinensis]|uniref:Type I secretion system permease/ATPase n=1 Tax=Idiomarina seosinensis TaxID=281739 RepID=A0A432ZGA5_9GAMM|nr:type I secretion system permease/ATPase [Idiomarina seosinensis]RUO76933.1 type I secretion system permease/ATPase [Idiomarina seosinensis]